VVQAGVIDPAWLTAQRRNPVETRPPRQGAALAVGALQPLPVVSELPACGYLRVDNAGEGLVSSGWLFDAGFTFDYQRINSLLLGIEAMRVKAVFITEKGVVGFNYSGDVLTAMAIDEAADSRIELIGDSREPWLNLEQQLLDCRIE
jgi:hypothetical protein